MSPESILLTGGAGFIGSHCVDYWLHHGVKKVTVLDSLKHKGRRARLAAFADDPRVKLVEIDLASRDWGIAQERLLLGVGQHQVMVNMASDSHVDRSIYYPIYTWSNNTRLVQNMLEAARLLKPRYFIQVSTDEVYGPAPEGTSHPEWSPIIPSNPYSASKAAQEALCVAYWRTYGVPVVITNTMNVIGNMQDPEKYLPMCVSKVLHGETVTVHGDPATGKVGSRFYTHAHNYADAVLFLTSLPGPARFGDPGVDRPDRYNVVGEREMDNLTLARTVALILGKTLDYKIVDFHSSRPGHDLRYALDGSKLRDMGWVHPVPLAQALAGTVKWYRDNPEWLA